MNKDIFKVFDILRFPLIIAVVCIHINPLITWGGVENSYTYSALNRSLPQMAVPLFFLMSGFLFFRDINEKWDWQAYKKKIKRRIWSLIIPYIIWNILAYSADLVWFGVKGILTKDFSYAIDYIKNFSLSVFWNSKDIGLHTVDWLGNSTATAGPVDLPLWYLRDLIVLVFLAPVLWKVFRYTKGFILGLFALAYISRIWINIPGFGITGLFFFSVGAYMGMRQLDVLRLCKTVNWIWIPCLILAVFSVIYKGTYIIIGQNIMPFYIITAVVTAINLARYFVEKGKEARPFLVKSCFFIFACHEVVVKDVANTIMRVVWGNSVAWPLQFVLIVVMIVIICMGLYYILQRFTPSLSRLLAGNK